MTEIKVPSLYELVRHTKQKTDADRFFAREMPTGKSPAIYQQEAEQTKRHQKIANVRNALKQFIPRRQKQRATQIEVVEERGVVLESDNDERALQISSPYEVKDNEELAQRDAYIRQQLLDSIAPDFAT